MRELLPLSPLLRGNGSSSFFYQQSFPFLKSRKGSSIDSLLSFSKVYRIGKLNITATWRPLCFPATHFGIAFTTRSDSSASPPPLGPPTILASLIAPSA